MEIGIFVGRLSQTGQFVQQTRHIDYRAGRADCVNPGSEYAGDQSTSIKKEILP